MTSRSTVSKMAAAESIYCRPTSPAWDSSISLFLMMLAGLAVVANLMPGRYGVVATSGADRIAKGEEWLQTNTLDGQKAHDSFLRIGEPSFFQEFGPAGYHVAIGFANPKIINGRLAGVCAGTDPNVTGTGCTNTVTGLVTTERMSRTPDERLYRDRKSTRLNSSHSQISYAVFCLKKKKKTNKTTNNVSNRCIIRN